MYDGTTNDLFQHVTVQPQADFAQNPLIAELSNYPYWTASDPKKMPIDMRHFLNTKTIRPAKLSDDSRPLVTLHAIDSDPNMEGVNRAFRLSARLTRAFMVDVEPKASDETLKKWAKWPAQYTEVSKNGGLHLLIQIPESFMDDELEDALNSLIQLKHGDSNEVEFLFNDHYITFTKRMMTDKTSSDFTSDYDKEALERLIAFIKSLATQKRLYDEAKINYALDNDPHDNELVRQQLDLISDAGSINLAYASVHNNPMFDKYLPSLEDCNNDLSLFEDLTLRHIMRGIIYGVGRALLDPIGNATIIKENRFNEYTEQDLIDLTYLYGLEFIEHRPKHDESRSGLPFLLSRAKRTYEVLKSDYENPEDTPRPLNSELQKRFKAFLEVAEANQTKGSTDA